MALASSLAASAKIAPPASGSGLASRLESARQAIEGRFLEAGDVLSRAVEGVGGLIAALDHIRQTLDTETVSATTRDLSGAAETLRSLPDSLEARRERVLELVSVGERLAGNIEEMRQHLAYLRVFAINIKITSGGIAAAGPEFAIFAQEIYDCIEMGRTQLDAFNADLVALETTLRAALAQEQALGRNCTALLPAVPDALMASAQAISEHHAKIASMATRVAAVARDVQKKVGGGLAALQIGDITRQRIEHVQAGLTFMAEAQARAELSADQSTRLRAYVHRLLSAQLGATSEDFHRDVSRIAQNISGMAADASELLRLRDLAYGQDDRAEGGFLRSLDSHVSQALGLVGDMTAGEQAAEEVSRSAALTAGQLTERIAGIQDMRADVQMMALNTTLKCSRIGDTGKPLGVIAVELRQHSIYLEKSAAGALTALASLAETAVALGQGSDGEAVSGRSAAAASVLDGAVVRIRKAGDGVETDLEHVARQGAEIVDMLRRAADRFDFHRQIGSVLDSAANDLLVDVGSGDIAVGDIAPTLRPIMDRLLKQYTMAQEREVHRAWTEDLMTGSHSDHAPEPDGDDGLF